MSDKKSKGRPNWAAFCVGCGECMTGEARVRRMLTVCCRWDVEIGSVKHPLITITGCNDGLILRL